MQHWKLSVLLSSLHHPTPSCYLMLRSQQSCHASSWRTLTKMETEALHIKTPVLESHPLTTLSGFRVFLKLENVQPVSSFKIRGVGNLCQKAMRKGCNHMVCSSGNMNSCSQVENIIIHSQWCKLLITSTDVITQVLSIGPSSFPLILRLMPKMPAFTSVIEVNSHHLLW